MINDNDLIKYYLTNLSNYDVATLIMDHLNFKNHSLIFKYSVDQIKYLKKEFNYITYIKKFGVGANYYWCPDLMSQFILLKNREKISTNFKRIKKDCIYEIID